MNINELKALIEKNTGENVNRFELGRKEYTAFNADEEVIAKCNLRTGKIEFYK